MLIFKLIACLLITGFSFAEASSSKVAVCSCSSIQQTIDDLKPTSCADVWASGDTTDGVYTIYPFSDPSRTLEVFCDMNPTDPGWITFLKRADGSVDFYLNWYEYVIGFGDKSNEHWLGLQNIHEITSQGDYELRVDMTDFAGESRYAKYSSFNVDSGSNYVLSVSGYSGDAGDSMSYHSGWPFSANDSDNDPHQSKNCAVEYVGAFWYNQCYRTNPTTTYSHTPTPTSGTGIRWGDWKPDSLKSIDFKIRKL